MAPPRARKRPGQQHGVTASSSSSPSSWSSKASSAWSWLYSFATEPTRDNLIWMSLLLLLGEVVLNALVIYSVPYTEIDWVAYMQEVAPVVKNATYDYSVLRGDTGPLVYPAGFVWIFSALYHATEEGRDLMLAQMIYAVLYVVNHALVLCLMVRTQKVPPFALVFLSLTKRVHSIFVLRLFNDPVAMLLLYAALNLFASGRWTAGSVLYSLAVSVKMNILLFAPALLLAYLSGLTLMGAIYQLAICGGIQLVLATPFLLENPWAYLKGSFDLGRVFLFKWTVNWRFLPEEIFVSRTFHVGLLLIHVLLLLICMPKWWRMLKSLAKLRQSDVGPNFSSQLLLLPLFMCNFIGICFARSLHYQFYVWYFHQLPYLLWCTQLSTPVRLLLLGLVELCWNVYPSTNWSSALLHASHGVILISLLWNLFGITSWTDRQLPKAKAQGRKMK